MNIKLILIIVVIAITIFTFSSSDEHFRSWYNPYSYAYPYSYGYPYTSNCMESAFGKTVCFPFTSWFTPTYYVQSYDLRGDIAPYPYWY